MKKIALILLLLASLLQTGCTPKKGFFAKDVLYESAIVWTKKGDIFNSLELKSSIVATYLNPLKKEFREKGGEWFLISLFVDKSSGIKESLNSKFITFQLNGKAPKFKKKLKYNDELIALAPFRNRWSSYYLVHFDSDEHPDLKLFYKFSNYGEVTLKFVRCQ